MLHSISLPNKVNFSKDEDNRSEVIIEPLYPGYGTTIGNALRRVLLSSLPGGAVTAVKIKGADHEFSTIENVREDVVDIILNLKKLRLKVHSDNPVKLELKAKGQKTVTAKDITKNSEVEIINSDLTIATLDNKNSELVMDIIVEQGRGYVPVEMREGEKLELGMIAVDAIYTPIKNANYLVENVRVGQITNYDKLTLTMETDGSITGREALDMASQILVEHFSLLQTRRLEESDQVAEMSDEAPAMEPEQPMSEETSETDSMSAQESEVSGTDILDLGLSNRAYNALVRNGIRTIEELKKLSDDQLKNLDGLGAKSLEEITKAIQDYAA